MSRACSSRASVRAMCPMSNSIGEGKAKASTALGSFQSASLAPAWARDEVTWPIPHLFEVRFEESHKNCVRVVAQVVILPFEARRRPVRGSGPKQRAVHHLAFQIGRKMLRRNLMHKVTRFFDLDLNTS